MRNLRIAFLVLTALFVGGCGALFLIYEVFTGPDPDFGSFLMLSIPSLIVGILAGWWALRIYKRPPGEQSADPDLPPKDQDGDADP